MYLGGQRRGHRTATISAGTPFTLPSPEALIDRNRRAILALQRYATSCRHPDARSTQELRSEIMPHISLGNDWPGIVSLFAYRPEAAKPMTDLVDLMLRGPNSLSPGERELIGTYVSGLNECSFCTNSHAAFAAAQLPEGMALVDQVRSDPDTAPMSPKMHALLRIAGAVQRGGKNVTDADVAAARQAGATDVEIHDTVLIAAMFCMANRYVDGLATTLPDDPAAYAQMADLIVSVGYSAVSGQPAA
jgi:uncharacterized peroxidase-related enzyme